MRAVFCEALPWSVLDSAAYQGLSHPARKPLLELCRRYVRDNNGRLLASRAHLVKRGWRSADVIQRAKDELVAAGLCMNREGCRPNKASWFALTFLQSTGCPDTTLARLNHSSVEPTEKTQSLVRLTEQRAPA